MSQMKFFLLKQMQTMTLKPPIEGRDVSKGQIVVQPIAEDEVSVNGTVLRESSSKPAHSNEALTLLTAASAPAYSGQSHP